MKNINKIIGLLLLAICLIACEEENKFPSSNIALTSVYNISNISNNGPVKINVYKEKPLAITYLTAANVFNFATTGYTDTSTETEYIIEWTVTEERTVEDNEGEEVIETYTVFRKVSASKDDGIGTMDVTATFPDGTVETTTHDVTVAEEQVYN